MARLRLIRLILFFVALRVARPVIALQESSHSIPRTRSAAPHGQSLSRDAIEHRLTHHLQTAIRQAASLGAKHVTMHTLRHTAAMNLLAAGVDVTVIALWLGHADTYSTDAYLHTDMTIKQAAIDRTRPPGVSKGIYHPEPDILSWLSGL